MVELIDWKDIDPNISGYEWNSINWENIDWKSVSQAPSLNINEMMRISTENEFKIKVRKQIFSQITGDRISCSRKNVALDYFITNILDLSSCTIVKKLRYSGLIKGYCNLSNTTFSDITIISSMNNFIANDATGKELYLDTNNSAKNISLNRSNIEHISLVNNNNSSINLRDIKSDYIYLSNYPNEMSIFNKVNLEDAVIQMFTLNNSGEYLNLKNAKINCFKVFDPNVNIDNIVSDSETRINNVALDHDLKNNISKSLYDFFKENSKKIIYYDATSSTDYPDYL